MAVMRAILPRPMLHMLSRVGCQKEPIITAIRSMAKLITIEQTILFSDIAGSSLLYERLGDARARSIISACIELMSRTVKSHQGQVIKTIGDEVMCCFKKPDDAARAAIRMQETASSDEAMIAYQVRLRIGMHHGPVLEDANDVYGDAVNVAARMVAQAKAGEILTTRYSMEKLSSDLIASARLVDEARLRGKQDPIEIYEISWGHPEELTMIGIKAIPPGGCTPFEEVCLTLDFQGEQVRVNGGQPLVTLGRDNGNRLVVTHPSVSRLHARIELRRSKFVLVDQSTNGSYIFPQNGPPIHLRRDEMPIEGEGSISLGCEVPPGSAHLIKYRVIAADATNTT